LVIGCKETKEINSFFRNYYWQSANCKKIR